MNSKINVKPKERENIGIQVKKKVLRLLRLLKALSNKLIINLNCPFLNFYSLLALKSYRLRIHIIRLNIIVESVRYLAMLKNTLITKF